jgi:hypothetical protein
MFHESGVLKVTDFGIAKVLAGDSPTSTSVPAGLTPAYASPEQLRGLKELTPASDVYSTGTVLYELLSRRLPFPTDIDLAAMVYKKVFEEPTDLRVVASDVPFPIADVVMRCLATEPTDRYPQAEAFGLALAAAATEAWGRSFLYPAGPILQAKRPIAILEDADRRPPPVVVSGAPNGSTLARALTAPARDRARPAPPGGSSQGATVTPDRPSARPAPHPGAHRGGRWAAALAVAIVAVLSAGLVWVAVRPTPGPASRPPPSPSPTATAPPGTALPEPGTDWVAYDFDQQPLGIAGATRQFPDTSGHGNDGVVRVLPPGLITVTAHDGHGHAIKFPDPCIAAPESACPRAVVQTADPSELNARDRDFTYGVAVLVQPTEAIPGATIVQKGRAGRRDSSQWKLQLETGGRISCVVVVQGSGAAYRALSTVTVADGGWHDVTCTRRGAELTIEVDASQPGRATLPPGLVFENDAPLRLGGNSIAVDNDQYSGALDNVFFRLGGS